MSESGFKSLLSAYDYPVPDTCVALSPAEPRDSARLLVYDRKANKTHLSTFAHILEFLPTNALLVFNNTKVIPARIYAKKPSGGTVELLATHMDIPTQTFTALGNKKLSVGDTLSVGVHTLTVLSTEGKYRIQSSLALETLFTESGSTPIPPYLKQTPLSEEALRTRYQTVFAKEAGSIAAPTASLHFTPELLQRITENGIESIEVTLHVNLGTFAPLTAEALISNQLHEESYFVSEAAAEVIQKAQRAGRPIIAVGTTAARTLESAWRDGAIQSGTNTTRLFIREGYAWQVVRGLITNFHVPKSSLLMLVAALVGREKLFELYALAERSGFKFFSFGDGMYITPE